MTNATIVGLTVRNGLGARRTVVLVILPVILIGLAITVRALVGVDEDATIGVMVGLGLTVVLPLVALIAGTSVLAAEVDDGSIVYLLAKPISRHTIVVSKYLVAVTATLLFTTLPIMLAGAIMTGELRGAIGYAAGALLGAFAYSAIFLLLSAVTRHAVAAGLLYVLIWEGLLGGLLTGVRWLSVGAWSTSLADSIVTDDILTKPVSPAYAIIATLVVTVGAVWLAGDRLRSFRLTGEE
ncbi:MAG TPA: ABC transporter permease subunit [Nocardioidaceae bacterium]|nr:ABC transporter permease subunit [Nocardioidaceae bacterium]